jgi:hypothetical protein
MRFAPTSTGGRIVEGRTPFGDFVVEWDSAGNLLRESLTIRTPCPRCGGTHDLAACPIPEGFTPEMERKRGGCCDPPKP